MNLSELREFLAAHKHLPGATIVVLQKDAEGNDFSPLENGYEARYVTGEHPWFGDVYPTSEEAETIQDFEEQWGEVPEDAVRAVVLRPVN